MIDKKAQTAHEISQVIAERWSPRAFSDKKVEKEKILSLFEAARWAPSAFNEQPWRFIAATKEDPEAFEKLLSCLADANQVWAKNAYLLVALVVKTTSARSGKPNRWAMHDCGLAMENLLLEAASQGLQGHPMAGFYADKVREQYGVPEDCDPLVMAAIGYVGDPGTLSDTLKARELQPRERRGIETFVFGKKWEESAEL